jgi:hypothetical protein
MDTPARDRVVRLQLTDAQKLQVRALTGRDGDALELTVEELEDRIAPRFSYTTSKPS